MDRERTRTRSFDHADRPPAGPAKADVAQEPLVEYLFSEGRRPTEQRVPLTPTWGYRIGMGLVAAASLLGLSMGGRRIVEQFDGQAGVEAGSRPGLWLTGFIVMVALAVAPWFWARIVGLVAGTAGAMLLGFALYAIGTHENLVPGEPVSLASGWWVLLIASLLACSGVTLATIRFHRARDVPAATARSRRGGGSLLLGVAAALFGGITGPAAVAVGQIARHEQRVSERPWGRRFARAGVVIGALAFALWYIGILAAGLTAEPTASTTAALPGARAGEASAIDRAVARFENQFPQLNDRWNQNSLRWVTAWQGPEEVSFEEFLQIQAEVEAAQGDLVLELSQAVEALPTAELRQAFGPLADHYATRLAALRTLYTATAQGTGEEINAALSDVQEIVAPSSVLEVLESIYSHPALRSVLERRGTNQDDVLEGLRAIVGGDAP